MSMYLRALGIHVYFATIKDLYFINGKHLEANTKVIHTLLSNDEGWELAVACDLHNHSLVEHLEGYPYAGR